MSDALGIARVQRAVAAIRASPLGSRFAHGAAWSLAGAIALRGAQLLAFIVAARILGRARFGQLAIIQTTVVVFGTLAGFGLGTTATKYVSEFRRTDPSRAGRISALSMLIALATGLAGTIAIYGLAPWLAHGSLAAPELEGPLRMSSVLVVLSAVNGAQFGILAGLEAFRASTVVSLLAGLITIPAIGLGSFWGGVGGAIWGLTASVGAACLLAQLAVRREARKAGMTIAIDGSWQQRKILWHFSIPSTLGAIAVGPALWYGSALLTQQPGGFAELGVFNAILRVKQMPELLGTTLLVPLLPILSHDFGLGNLRQYRQSLALAYRVSFLVSVPFALLVTTFPDLVLIPYGSEFKNNPLATQWLMLHLIAVALFQPVGSILASINQMWVGAAYNLAWSGTYISLALLLVPRYQGPGLAAAMAATHIVTTIPCVLYLRRKAPIALIDRLLSNTGLTALLFAGSVWMSSRTAGVLALTLGVLTALFATFWGLAGMWREAKSAGEADAR
jgi:O-antigen/teichoic acid export membrane protein